MAGWRRFESRLWQTASLLLHDGESAVLVDPCIARDEVEAIAAHVAAAGLTVTDVLVTHADWDHVCGLAAFPDARATMSEAAAERLADPADVEARLATAAAEYGLELLGPPRADRTFAPGAAIAAGPFTVETAPLRGHTRDGVAYRVRGLGLLAVGDHLSAIEFPFCSSTAEYRATLAALADTLRRDPPEVVIPGHGPALTAGEALAIAEADLAYLHELRDAVLRGGRPAGLAVEPPRGDPDDRTTHGPENVDAQVAELATA